jgi:hypothetical protein
MLRAANVSPSFLEQVMETMGIAAGIVKLNVL